MMSAIQLLIERARAYFSDPNSPMLVFASCRREAASLAGGVKVQATESLVSKGCKTEMFEVPPQPLQVITGANNALFFCFLFLPVPSKRIGLDSGACISTRQEEIRSNNKDLAGRPAIAVVTRNALRLFVSKRFGGQLPIVRHPGPYDRNCRPPATSVSGNHGSLACGQILVGEFFSLLLVLTCKYQLNFDFFVFGFRFTACARGLSQHY